MISIRRADADDAQSIGLVFNAAVHDGWKYLGELSRRPMFPPDEWDKLVVEQAPPNALLVAVDEPGTVAGFTAVRVQEGEMFLLFVHPEFAGRGVGRTLLDAAHDCVPPAAERCFSTRTNKTKERLPSTRPPDTAATARCANRIFAAFAYASRAW
jgi:GNAT superfamily N-acetyltransferase